MWPRIQCNCGEALGEYWDAWKTGQYTLDQLGITAQCCRMKMITTVEFKDLLQGVKGGAKGTK